MQNQAHVRHRSRGRHVLPAVPVRRVPGVRVEPRGNGDGQSQQQPRVHRSSGEQLEVQPEELAQPDDDVRRGLSEQRERQQQRARRHAAAGRADRRRRRHADRLGRPAHGDQDARRVCAGADRVARPDVHHRRRSLRPEQRVRRELPARVLSEGESLVADVRRVVVPARAADEHVPPSLGVRSVGCAARSDRRAAHVLGDAR